MHHHNVLNDLLIIYFNPSCCRVSESGQVVQNSTEAVSLAGDFNNSHVQWATLGPQNTYITFHTLPFNLDQIRGTTELATVGESGELSIISSDVSVVNGQEQFILSDGGSSKQFVLSDTTNSKQFVLSDTTNSKQFVLSDGNVKELVLSDSAGGKQFVLSDSDDVKEFVLSDGGNGKQFVLSNSENSKQNVAFPKPLQTQLILQNSPENKPDLFPVQSQLILQTNAEDKSTIYPSSDQSRIILQTSVPAEPNTVNRELNASFREPDQSQFIIQNTTKDSTSSYPEPDLSGFIMPNSSRDTSLVESNSSQFMSQASTPNGQNTPFTEPNQSAFMLQNSAKCQSDPTYSESIQSSLASQFGMETSVNGKVDTIVPRSIQAEFTTGNQSAPYPQLLSTDVDKLSVGSVIF